MYELAAFIGFNFTVIFLAPPDFASPPLSRKDDPMPPDGDRSGKGDEGGSTSAMLPKDQTQFEMKRHEHHRMK